MKRTIRCVAAGAVIAAAGCGRTQARPTDPITVATGGVSNPTVAQGQAGVVVSWVGQDGNVYVARPLDSAAKPVRANDVAGEAAPHEQAPAQVAVGPDSSVYVIWQTRVPIPGRRFPASDLRFARSSDGGRTFEPSLTINDDKGGRPTSHTFHDLMVDPQGTIYASWIDGRTTEGRKSGEWSAGNPEQHHEQAARAEQLGPEIRVARSTDGGRTFSRSVVVDRDACPCCRTSLARGPDGTLYIAWRKIFAGDVRDIVVARSTDGGASFEAPVRVYGDNWVYPGCPHAGPSLAVDGAGTLHVVWYTGAEGRAGLYIATSRDGRTFTQPIGLKPNTRHVPVSHARLAAAGDAVWAAWEDRTVPAGQVALSRCGADGKVEDLGALRGSGRSPAIAGGSATPAVAWLAGDTVRVATIQP